MADNWIGVTDVESIAVPVVPKLCACGCGQPVRKASLRFLVGHYERSRRAVEAPPAGSGLCECGCGQATELAPYTSSKRGWFKGQPKPWVGSHGKKRRGPAYLVEDRGYKTPCWIWQGAKHRDGYGNLWHEGCCRLAHCVYYEQAYGPIPEGQELDHRCRVRSCIRPDHVEPVTHTENMRRASNTRLTAAAIRAIRAMKGEDARVVAARFGVVRDDIYEIWNGKCWQLEDEALDVLEAAGL